MALTVAQRAANYYRQKYRHNNGEPDGWRDKPPKLTPAQVRRIRRKRNHQIRQAINRKVHQTSQAT